MRDERADGRYRALDQLPQAVRTGPPMADYEDLGAVRATSAASLFFYPIIIGPYKASFVDGVTGANNPVAEMWRRAQDL